VLSYCCFDGSTTAIKFIFKMFYGGGLNKIFPFTAEMNPKGQNICILLFLIMLLFNKYVFYELLYQQIYHPPFICRLDTLYITCLTLIVFVIVVMNEIVSLVPRSLYLIDWTAVSGN
jgi:hypothetical protein